MARKNIPRASRCVLSSPQGTLGNVANVDPIEASLDQRPYPSLADFQQARVGKSLAVDIRPDNGLRIENDHIQAARHALPHLPLAGSLRVRVR